jgi:cytochrome c oxidase cbb3-type subunit III
MILLPKRRRIYAPLDEQQPMSRHLVHIVAAAIFVAGCIVAFAAQSPRNQSQGDSAVARKQSEDDSLRSMYPNLPSNQDPDSVIRGKRVFESNCGFCHGADATGGNGGPDLVRSVLVNHDEKGNLIAPVIREGRISKGMPAFSLSDTQVSDSVAFLHQRNRDARLRFTYKIPNVAIGNAADGKAYFDSHCGSCHSVSGDLAGVGGKYSPDELQQRWLDPVSHKPARVTIVLPSGQSYSGDLQHLDEFSASLYDATGIYHSFNVSAEARVQVTEPLEAHHRLLRELSDRDLHNVTTYLETLK